MKIDRVPAEYIVAECDKAETGELFALAEREHWKILSSGPKPTRTVGKVNPAIVQMVAIRPLERTGG